MNRRALVLTLAACGDNDVPVTYANPSGGQLRLVKNDASAGTTVVLDFIVGDQPLVGYSTGFDLPLRPGQVYELDIEIHPTCIVVPKGFRVALTVRGKDYVYPGGSGGKLSNMKNEFTGVGPFLLTVAGLFDQFFDFRHFKKRKDDSHEGHSD